MHFSFSTAQLPEGLTSDACLRNYQDHISKVYSEVEIVANDNPFQAKLTATLLDDLSFTTSCGTKSHSFFGGWRARPESGDRFGFAINIGANAVRTRHRGRDEWIAPGEAILVSRGDEGDFASASPTMSLMVFDCPRKALVGLAPRAEDCVARPVTSDNQAVSMLQGYATSIEASGGMQTTDLRSHATRTIVELIALSLGRNNTGAAGAGRPGLKHLRTERICDEITARFSEPGFSVATLAKKFFLSERQIRDILHHTGAGFTERLVEARLNHARGQLISQRHSGRKVSDIAYDCGFNDLSYFNRSFRQRFGMTPSDARMA